MSAAWMMATSGWKCVRSACERAAACGRSLLAAGCNAQLSRARAWARMGMGEAHACLASASHATHPGQTGRPAAPGRSVRGCAPARAPPSAAPCARACTATGGLLGTTTTTTAHREVLLQGRQGAWRARWGARRAGGRGVEGRPRSMGGPAAHLARAPAAPAAGAFDLGGIGGGRRKLPGPYEFRILTPVNVRLRAESCLVHHWPTPLVTCAAGRPDGCWAGRRARASGASAGSSLHPGYYRN